MGWVMTTWSPGEALVLEAPAPTRIASRPVAAWAVWVEAAALMILVASDGPPTGSILRAGVVLAITAWALLIGLRGGQVRAGLTMAGLGVVGIVEGAGIGGVYLVKVGLAVVTVAGLVALAAGLVLLVGGGVVLTWTLRGWWRLLAIPASLALLVFVLYPLTIAVNATNRPATPLGTSSPSDHGLRYEDVVVRTSDGVALSGWYVPSSNGAAVLMLHGAGSTRSAVLRHGVVLAGHGYGVLMIDTRGHGRSEGRAMDFGWYAGTDVPAALSFLSGRPDVAADRIGVVGLSMGGEQAISAAAPDPRVRVVIAEGVTGMQAADHGWLPGGFAGAIERGLEWVQYEASDLLTDASKPTPMRDAIAAMGSKPLLIIAGGATTSEADAGRWLRAVSPSSVDLWIVSGAGHTQAFATDPAGWEARVLGHLDAALENG